MPATESRRWYALTLLCVAGFMVILDAVAVGGLALVGAGSALLARVRVDGGFVGDLLPGLLLFGPGLGACAVAGSVGHPSRP
ncbi:hypothetical protein ACWC09_00880 [Streptomyces sp. NPDC001617]